MAGLATKETNKSVDAFIDSIDNKSKQQDSKILLSMMQEITGHKAKIWGDNFIVGFGKYTYRRKNQKEDLEWFNVGFAPRKSKMTIYLTMDLTQHEDLLGLLGKCSWGKGCLYINKLADVDMEILRELITKSKNATWH